MACAVVNEVGPRADLRFALVRHPLALLLSLPQAELVALLTTAAAAHTRRARAAAAAASVITIIVPSAGPRLASIKELVMVIVSYVPPAERGELRLVCKDWREWSDDDFLWRPLLLAEFNLRPQARAGDTSPAEGRLRRLYWQMYRARRDAYRNNNVRRNAQAIAQAGISIATLNAVLAPWRDAVAIAGGGRRGGAWWRVWG